MLKKALSFAIVFALLVTAFVAVVANPTAHAQDDMMDTVRFATFNASMNRGEAGELLAALEAGDDPQIQAVAEIIQIVRPDVLLINEFDYDETGVAYELFQDNYLSQSFNGSEPIEYPYYFAAPSNTGIPSGFDLNRDDEVGGPDDAFGFGFFPGQYGMAVYSMYEIDEENARTFQTFLWADMPDALLPVDPETGESWYDDDTLGAFRLSSKSHWDLPIIIGDDVVHFLVAHPTPPVFDGPEDRNGTRNHDEIRFWADYVAGADYIYDDAGVEGGLADGSFFVIAGDYNSDPFDGDSVPGSAQLLLENDLINGEFIPASEGGVEATEVQGDFNLTHEGDPAYDTGDFNPAGPGNLRVDYVLPSVNLEVVDGAVFWPTSDDEFFRLTGEFPFPSSDHKAVWIEVTLP